MKESASEKFNEGVGCSCYPRGDQPVLCVHPSVVMESTAAETFFGIKIT